MSVTSEKIEIEKNFEQIQTEKNQLSSKVDELLKEKSQIEETFQLSKDEKSRLESKLVQLTDVAMKQKITLVNFFKIFEYYCCELTLTHDVTQEGPFSGQAFFPGAHLCNGILAVSYDLYICHGKVPIVVKGC